MTKGLEALEKTREFAAKTLFFCENQYEKDFYTQLDIVEKELKDFEWLIGKLTIDFIHNLTDPEDKMRVLSFFGIRIAMEEIADEK